MTYLLVSDRAVSSAGRPPGSQVRLRPSPLLGFGGQERRTLRLAL